MSDIVKFPYSASRRVAARRPRRSKNGTPEERAVKRVVEAAPAPVIPRRSKNGTPAERAAKAAAEKLLPRNIIAAAYKSNSHTHAALHRAAKIVIVLGECHVRDGWTLDKARAERFLESMCLLDPHDGDAMGPIVEWVADHGQSLDWIFRGDPGSMILAAAAVAPIAAKHSRPKLVAITRKPPPSPGAA